MGGVIVAIIVVVAMAVITVVMMIVVMMIVIVEMIIVMLMVVNMVMIIIIAAFIPLDMPVNANNNPRPRNPAFHRRFNANVNSRYSRVVQPFQKINAGFIIKQL